MYRENLSRIIQPSCFVDLPFLDPPRGGRVVSLEERGAMRRQVIEISYGSSEFIHELIKTAVDDGVAGASTRGIVPAEIEYCRMTP